MLHGSLGVKRSVKALSLNRSISSFASCDPSSLSGTNPHTVQNLVGGQWFASPRTYDVVDPLNGEKFIQASDCQSSEIDPFVKSLSRCPKYGLHNPLYNPERYRRYGDVFCRAASELRKEETLNFFTRCIQRVLPKSTAQARAEVVMMRSFMENFSGDNGRLMCQGFVVAGDREGSQTIGYRFPYGPVAVIAPFNFPLEIVGMQTLSAALVGNKVLVKADDRMSLVMEQWIRFMHSCGLPPTDIDFISCKGPVMSEVIKKAEPRLVQFTGSSAVGDALAVLTKGKVKVEDSGFDWKILGHDVDDIEYVAWQCDQDAYAMSGQKCSAQSILFAHENWVKKANIFDRIAQLAQRRKLSNGTLSPVITHDNASIQQYVNNLLSIPGSRLLFGNEAITEDCAASVPRQYGTIKPTAVFVPIEAITQSEQHLAMCTKELFGPVQIVTEWKTGQEDTIINICEKMSHHLTAGIVSNDMLLCQKFLRGTINGTTYFGRRARTTGAPQNHWFGPAGDPRAAGIHTREAILQTWTCHREVIQDVGPVPEGWTLPAAT